MFLKKFASYNSIAFYVSSFTKSNLFLIIHSLLTELVDAIYSVLDEMQLWQSNAWHYCM